jgi:hypothetical protein
MRALSLVSLIALGLCAGCTAPTDSQSASVQGGRCASGSQQASMAPIACAPAGRLPAGLVYTHPNGNGPQVELWGPPSWSGGGSGG